MLIRYSHTAPNLDTLDKRLMRGMAMFTADMNEKMFGGDPKRAHVALVAPILKFDTTPFSYWKGVRSASLSTRGVTLKVTITKFSVGRNSMRMSAILVFSCHTAIGHNCVHGQRQTSSVALFADLSNIRLGRLHTAFQLSRTNKEFL